MNYSYGRGYFNAPGEDPCVLLRVKGDYDGVEFSKNSIAAINMIRLSSIYDAAKFDSYKCNAGHFLVSSSLVSYGNLDLRLTQD